MILPRALFVIWLALVVQLSLVPGAALAQQAATGSRTMVAVSWVEEWDPAAQRWVRVEEAQTRPRAGTPATQDDPVIKTAQLAPGVTVTEKITTLAPSYAPSSSAPAGQPQFGFIRPRVAAPGIGQPVAQYGPFRVLDGTRAALVSATDVTSPRQFDAMLRDYPSLRVIEMVDAPGTSHDLANLALGRRIRAAGLDTHVPQGGSVRSGAVELFLAGAHQTIAPGATFAVHSWLDTRGMEPRDYAEDAPENRLYLDYYMEMGMGLDHARAFYAMTNSVPHSGALWLDAAAMQNWIAPMKEPELPPVSPVTIAAATGGEGEQGNVGAVAHRDGLLAAADMVWRSVVHSHSKLASAAQDEAPVIAYADLAPIALARLDSRPVFP